MNCWHCGTELIWGGDHDIDHEDEDYCMETNLSCPNCGAFHMVYLPKDKQEDEPEMWKHFCEVERSQMEIGKGEACSWCGEEEYESRS
jgi:DNA-directed RNA polymerase subunit RPC12/RpoP